MREQKASPRTDVLLLSFFSLNDFIHSYTNHKDMMKPVFIVLITVLFSIHSFASNNNVSVPQHKQKNVVTLSSDFKDATLVTLQGDTVQLSDYVGHHKFVLVDFWASWCGPCMREMPNVKAAYTRYKSRGLEIVGISLDKQKASWQGAVKRVGITWPQMTDMCENGSKIASIYGVRYIPYVLIFDQKGNIVASNLHGEEMLQRLEELMPSK